MSKRAENEPGPEFEVPIERGKIREYAAATQSDSPAYQAPDAVVPPTFLVTSSFWVPEEARAEHGFDRKRLLHGEQEYVFHGPPPRAGDVLRASSRVVDRYEKPGKRGGTMRFAVIVTEFRDERGEPVAEQRQTLIETAKRTEEGR